MKALTIKLTAGALLACFVTSCASPQDQFGYAVKHGNLQMAQANMGRNYANMRVYETPTQYSVPIQFAILRNDTRMADFLLANGAHRSLDGKSLAYYSAINGRSRMARYFVNKGAGSSSDISRAISDKAAEARRQREQSQMAGLIGLAVLGAMMNSGGGNSQSDAEEDRRASQINMQNYGTDL